MNFVKKLSIIFAIVAIIITSSCSSAKKENLRLLEKGYNYESSLNLNIELNDFAFKGEYDGKKIKDSDSLIGLLNTHNLAMKYKTVLNDNNTITRKYYDCTFENASYEGDNIKFEIERPWYIWNYNGSISKDDIKKITDDFLLYPISAFNRFDNGTYILTQNTKMGNKVSFDVKREDVDGQNKVVHSVTRLFEREFGVRHSIMSAAKKRKAGEVWVLESSELKDLLDSGLTNLKLEGSLILQAENFENKTILKILPEYELNGRLKDSELKISWIDTKENELSVEIKPWDLKSGDFNVEIYIDTEKEIVALATIKINNLEYKVNIKEISGTSADIEATGNVSLNLKYTQTKEKIKE